MNNDKEIEINPITMEMLFDRLDSIGKEIEELVDELKNRKG